MTKQVINIGIADKGDGDPLRVAFSKVNDNFTELYNLLNNDAAGTVISTDIIGSVFADDSTLIVDGVNGTIPGYVSISTLKSVVAQSSSFADFQTRIAAL
jgi:hypothetical protein